jgi:hypothetical protein
MVSQELVNQFMEMDAAEGWMVITSDRFSPYVNIGYHQPAEDVSSVNVHLHPQTHNPPVEVSWQDERETFTDLQEAYSFVTDLLIDLSDDSGE